METLRLLPFGVPNSWSFLWRTGEANSAREDRSQSPELLIILVEEGRSGVLTATRARFDGSKDEKVEGFAGGVVAGLAAKKEEIWRCPPPLEGLERVATFSSSVAVLLFEAIFCDVREAGETWRRRPTGVLVVVVVVVGGVDSFADFLVFFMSSSSLS